MPIRAPPALFGVAPLAGCAAFPSSAPFTAFDAFTAAAAAGSDEAGFAASRLPFGSFAAVCRSGFEKVSAAAFGSVSIPPSEGWFLLRTPPNSPRIKRTRRGQRGGRSSPQRSQRSQRSNRRSRRIGGRLFRLCASCLDRILTRNESVFAIAERRRAEQIAAKMPRAVDAVLRQHGRIVCQRFVHPIVDAVVGKLLPMRRKKAALTFRFMRSWNNRRRYA